MLKLETQDLTGRLFAVQSCFTLVFSHAGYSSTLKMKAAVFTAKLSAYYMTSRARRQ
jgi:hypothetical protein